MRSAHTRPRRITSSVYAKLLMPASEPRPVATSDAAAVAKREVVKGSGTFDPPECDIQALGLSNAEAAQALGISCSQMHRVTSGNCAISPDLALRLEVVFDSSVAAGLTAETHAAFGAFFMLPERIRFLLHSTGS